MAPNVMTLCAHLVFSESVEHCTYWSQTEKLNLLWSNFFVLLRVLQVNVDVLRLLQRKVFHCVAHLGMMYALHSEIDGKDYISVSS
jgi:hypothetical protein